MRAPDRREDPEIYARASGSDLASQLRAEIDRDHAAALERCPAARAVLDRMRAALRGRVTRLTKAQRRLRAIGVRREDGSHGSR